jgi:hypothetical protein
MKYFVLMVTLLLFALVSDASAAERGTLEYKFFYGIGYCIRIAVLGALGYGFICLCKSIGGAVTGKINKFDEDRRSK